MRPRSLLSSPRELSQKATRTDPALPAIAAPVDAHDGYQLGSAATSDFYEIGDSILQHTVSQTEARGRHAYRSQRRLGKFNSTLHRTVVGDQIPNGSYPPPKAVVQGASKRTRNRCTADVRKVMAASDWPESFARSAPSDRLNPPRKPDIRSVAAHMTLFKALPR